jgi:hypothetical protein
MSKKNDRRTTFSGLDLKGLDNDVRQTLMQGAAPNRSALTAKQRWDRKRKRLSFDLNQQVIEALRLIAQEESASISRLGSFLLAWALLAYFEDPALSQILDDHKRPVYISQFDWAPEPPADWLERLSRHLEAARKRQKWGQT